MLCGGKVSPADSGAFCGSSSIGMGQYRLKPPHAFRKAEAIKGHGGAGGAFAFPSASGVLLFYGERAGGLFLRA